MGLAVFEKGGCCNELRLILMINSNSGRAIHAHMLTPMTDDLFIVHAYSNDFAVDLSFGMKYFQNKEILIRR